jgi:hypothetical protein
MRPARDQHSGDWRIKPAEYRVSRAKESLELFEQGDTSEDHLAQATIALLVAMQAKNGSHRTLRT